MTESEHDWFAERVAAYVVNGLSTEEQERLQRHAEACPECAAELANVKHLDHHMNLSFTGLSPKSGFDDAIIRRLDQPSATVRSAAIAAAAAIMLGGLGYFCSELINNGRLPPFALSFPPHQLNSHFQQIGKAITLYSSDSKGSYPRSAFKTDVKSSLSGSVQDIAHGEDGNRVLFGDGHVEFTQNPLYGVQRDNIYTANTTGNQSTSGGGGTSLNSPFDSNDSILLPIDDDEKSPSPRPSQQNAAIVTGTATPFFKPFAVVPDGQGLEKELKGIGQLKDQMRASGIEARQDTSNSPSVVKKVDVSPPFTAQPATAQSTSQPSPRKIIRNGEMQFDVDSFDSAAMQISHIVTEESGYLGTTNSDRLPNGKVSGTIEVRVPPDHLDVLVLKLRALGDPKQQKITAEDITKQYTDLNSELRADRAMEVRLLDLIQNGKGQIKDLLAVEKELGDWRKKIETITGQLNYDDNLIAYSTLVLTLTEKNIQKPALASQTETVDMGVETEDVARARDAALKTIDEVKGRIIDSELKQLDAGQVAGKIIADLPAGAAGGVIDRLKQLGTVSRLEAQRQEVTTDGQGNPVPAQTLLPGVRSERKDTRLTVSLYNLANIAPRETTVAELACDDVEAAYHAILARVDKAGGRVLSSALSRPKPDEVTGSVAFEVKAADSDGVLLDVRTAGDVMQLNTTKNPDTMNVTTSKRGFSVQLRSIATVDPRQVCTLSLATVDVPTAYDKLLTTLAGMKARIVMSRLDKEENQVNQAAGYVDFEVKKSDADAAESAITALGDPVERRMMRSTDNQNTLDTKTQFKVSLHNASLLPAKEAWTLAIESNDVERAQSAVSSAAQSSGGRVVDSSLTKEANGKSTAHLAVEVPFAQSAAMLQHLRQTGELRAINSTKNPSTPDGKLTRSTFDITLGIPDSIVKDDRGVWGTVRSGLSTSIGGLLWSLELVVIGFCFVLPWGLLVTVGWKLWRRWTNRKPQMNADERI